jgi:hypothetical protein
MALLLGSVLAPLAYNFALAQSKTRMDSDEEEDRMVVYGQRMAAQERERNLLDNVHQRNHQSFEADVEKQHQRERETRNQQHELSLKEKKAHLDTISTWSDIIRLHLFESALIVMNLAALLMSLERPQFAIVILADLVATFFYANKYGYNPAAIMCMVLGHSVEDKQSVEENEDVFHKNTDVHDENDSNQESGNESKNNGKKAMHHEKTSDQKGGGGLKVGFKAVDVGAHGEGHNIKSDKGGSSEEHETGVVANHKESTRCNKKDRTKEAHAKKSTNVSKVVLCKRCMKMVPIPKECTQVKSD